MSNMTASVIPYYDELENFGIILHKESEDQIPMKKFDWPRKLGHRQPSGGSDDAVCHETISIAWRHNELWVKTPLESTLEAKSLSEKEFSFFGYFYAQLDGDVAYVPKSDEYDFLIIFCEKQKHDHQRIFHAIKFPRGSTVQIDAFVIHTIPIPIMDDGKDEVFNVDMYHRAVNAKSKFISPQNIYIHLLNIDQKTFIPLLDEFFIDKSSEPRLSEHFTHKTLNLEEVNQDNFKLYGSLMPNSAHHIEKVNPAHWPYLKKFEKYSKIGPLEQDFRLSWSSHGHDDIQQLIFHGLSGTYDGKEGKPGIEYNPTIKEYVVNVLSTRPDGSYYLHAKHLETRFAMIFALPDENNGDPIETTLKVFLFQNGQALSIHSNIWHSLPILIHPHTAEFREVVCETNASIDINLPYECGSGLKFKYGL